MKTRALSTQRIQKKISCGELKKNKILLKSVILGFVIETV